MDRFLIASFRGFACALALACLSACNSDDTSSGTGSVPDPTHANVTPHIGGQPGSDAVVGQQYDFTPNAGDADGDALTFSIAGMPGWASFNTHTGELSGLPNAGDVGSHEEIAISVTDGESTANLHQFAINVVRDRNGNGDGTATLTWQPPTENIDGSHLTNLHGYRIHEGTAPGYYTNTIALDNAGLTSYVLENLTPGIHYFAVTALTGDGTESALSGEVSKTI